MASPLILKIQAQLERRGFDDVKRQIDRLKEAISGLGERFQETEEESRGFIRGVVTAVALTTAALLAVGIQQERVTAQLANSLVGLGLDADDTADAIQDLTAEMARNSLFARRELLGSLSILTRSTQSLTLAQQDALIAQELALRNNVSLEQASKALALANIGEGRALATLVNLGEREIETLRERGTLREALARIAPIGEATGRELNTISGAIDQFTTRAASGFIELGDIVREGFSPAINFATNVVNILSFTLDEFLDNTIFKERRATEQANLLGIQFDEINSALERVGGTGEAAFGDIQEAISNIDVTLDFITTRLGDLNSVEEATVRNLQRQRAELIETQETGRALRQTSLRDQIRIFQTLSLSREDFQRRELLEERRKLQNLKEANADNAEELLVIQAALTNNRLRTIAFEQSIIIGNIEEEIDARRTLFTLLQAPAGGVDETASIEERGRALDRALQSRSDNLLLIESERVATLALVELERERSNLAEDDFRVVNQRRIIEAQADAARLEAQRDFIALATEIGPLETRPDLRARAEGEIETLLRRQTVTRNEQSTNLQQQVLDTKELARLERDIETLRERGDERGDPLVERLINRAQQVREALGDVIVPTSEEAIENLVTEIERKLDIPPININLNIDQLTLIEAIRAELTTILEAQGFSLNREATAPSGLDTEQ